MNYSALISSFASQEGSLYGSLSPADVADLRKAMSIGYTNPPAGGTAGDASPLRPESLDPVMRNLQWTSKHLTMSRMIPKTPGHGPLEAWNQLTSYGAQTPGFLADGAPPEEIDSTMRRIYSQSKLIGVMGRVTTMTELSQTVHGPALALETSFKTQLLASMIESALFWADSSINPLEWDGIEAQVTANAPSNILDGRGRKADSEILMDMATRIGASPNWGVPSHVFMGPRVKRDMIKDLLPNGRWMMDGSSNVVRGGADVTAVDTSYGSVQIVPTPFLTNGITQDGGEAPSAAVGDSSRRPATPTLTTASTSPVNAASEFEAADVSAYAYEVVAVNNAGKSAPLTVTGHTPAAGDDVRFGVTPGAGAPLPTCFEVYRTKVGDSAGTKYFIKRVAAAAAGAETTIIDLNASLPDTHKIFMFEFNPNVIQMYQLLALARIPFARVDLSTKFALLSIGQPAVKAPTKVVIMKNLSLDSTAFGD